MPSSRLDFQTFSGYTVDTTTAGVGFCTDSFVAAGQSGVNPPTICGTNTGYHSKTSRDVHSPTSLYSVYVEFGAAAGDTITLTNTFTDLTAKSWNILARQIACTASWK